MLITENNKTYFFSQPNVVLILGLWGLSDILVYMYTGVNIDFKNRTKSKFSVFSKKTPINKDIVVTIFIEKVHISHQTNKNSPVIGPMPSGLFSK